MVNVKFFKRFKKTDSADNWSTGETSWDAIKIVPNKNVIIHGVGIYEPFPDGGDFVL